MSPYKVIIAPDSFKESMSAKEAALAIKDGFKRCSIPVLYMTLFLWLMVARNNRSIERSLKCYLLLRRSKRST